jgi:hypothetical protein
MNAGDDRIVNSSADPIGTVRRITDFLVLGAVFRGGKLARASIVDRVTVRGRTIAKVGPVLFHLIRHATRVVIAARVVLANCNFAVGHGGCSINVRLSEKQIRILRWHRTTKGLES